MREVQNLKDQLDIFNDIGSSKAYKNLALGFKKCETDIAAIQPIGEEDRNKKENVANVIQCSYNILQEKSKQHGDLPPFPICLDSEDESLTSPICLDSEDESQICLDLEDASPICLDSDDELFA